MISTNSGSQHTAVPAVFDLHVDPILQHLLFGYDIRQEHNASWQPQKRRLIYAALQALGRWKKLHRPFFNHIDLPRMRTGGYAFGAFGIHHWPVQSERGWNNVLRQLEYFHRVAERENDFVLVRNPEDLQQAQAAGKMAGFPAVEGVHCLGKGGKQTENKRLKRLEVLRSKYGVGYLTLAHFSKNDAATPCLGLGSNPGDGLTDFGKTIIETMNDLGIIVDVAHVNNRGALDACRFSRKPVIVSHTGLKAIHDFPRNISDEVLQAVATTGGIIGVMFATNFLSPDKTNPDSSIIIEHFDYIVQQVGEDHAAIGSDFDGWIPRIPQNLNDAADLPVLVKDMQRIGYSAKRISKIMGENFMRVWGEVEVTQIN